MGLNKYYYLCLLVDVYMWVSFYDDKDKVY